MSRLPAPPKNPVLLAVLMDLVRAQANGTIGSEGLDGAVSQALRRSDPDGRIARKLVANMERLRIPPGRTRTLSDDDIADLFRPSFRRWWQLFDDVIPPPVPEYRPGTNFTIAYTGLYCQLRTGDREIFGPSDEPYVVTSAVNVESGENRVRTENVPVAGPKHYDDVDSGEWRRGPFSACWFGPATEVSLVATVLENDEGDPDAYRDEIDDLVSAAAAVAAFNGYPIPDAVQDLAVDAINWFVDSDDDSIGTETRILSEEDLRRYASRPARLFTQRRPVIVFDGPFRFREEEVLDNTDLPYHFTTRHTADGEYVVTFRVTADQDPLPIRPEIGPDAVGDNVGQAQEGGRAGVRRVGAKARSRTANPSK